MEVYVSSPLALFLLLPTKEAKECLGEGGFFIFSLPRLAQAVTGSDRVILLSVFGNLLLP